MVYCPDGRHQRPAASLSAQPEATDRRRGQTSSSGAADETPEGRRHTQVRMDVCLRVQLSLRTGSRDAGFTLLESQDERFLVSDIIYHQPT